MQKSKISKTVVDRMHPLPDRQYVEWDSAESGFGVRVSPGGAKAYIWQGRVKGELVKMTIGRCDKMAADYARNEAKKINIAATRGEDPRTKIDKSASTFGDMLTAYADLLEAKEKESAPAVRRVLSKDVQQSHPRIWRKPAKEITLEDCLVPVGTLVESGALRQADKLRSYIRAAFAEAVNARADAKAPKALRDLRLTSNPARDLRRVEGSSNANERALSLNEFRAYWKRIKELSEPSRSLAMLHVLTGGQRQQQLQRVTLQNVDKDTSSLTILDRKGRRAVPRRHVIPLLPEALEIVESLTEGGPFVFSLDSGKSAAAATAVYKIAKRVCADMQAAEELEGEPFTAGAIRATIETRLAAKPYRVSERVLGQLLSHGLGGVQNRNYQRHDFFEEKREALEMLWRMLESIDEPGAQIIPLKRRQELPRRR